MNDYIDEVVTNMNVYVKENGYDPIEMEGLESSFKWVLFSSSMYCPHSHFCLSGICNRLGYF